MPDAVLQEELRVARARRDLEGVRRYARRLALPQKQIDWLVSEFAPSAADVLTNPNATTSEPAWFKPVARSCRKQASLKAPGLEDADSANLTDLDLAVATQFGPGARPVRRSSSRTTTGTSRAREACMTSSATGEGRTTWARACPLFYRASIALHERAWRCG